MPIFADTFAFGRVNIQIFYYIDKKKKMPSKHPAYLN